ncbi:MAG: DUF3068 domain-containing protein [Anaerolineales bacterium]|nr:DUF3068 domain-containing protein [Anaerolineales bacterium]
MKTIGKYIFIALVFLTAAGLLRVWIAPIVGQLPTNYSVEMEYTQKNEYRESPTDSWETHNLIARRVDQTFSTSNKGLIVQSGLHVYFEDGSVNYVTTALYGVDRRSRLNVTDLGDTQRSGQFLFPPSVQKSTYVYWDSIYIGPCTATFDRIEDIDGLNVYVFNFTAENLDETDGYSYLPFVPEPYRAVTNGRGILWIEPVSGIVVDYEDQGSSSYVDTSTGSVVAEFSRWDERYEPETIANQLDKAWSARRQIMMLEIWLPGGLVLAGAAWLVIGLVRRKNQD